ncbi:hypothetical protein CTKA_02670 [Chthonomonas calidirosea]|uniref:Uncharacterized protein n=1 Tax=Chthonomonas calidirosea (strain DSM 23976 / ICMP 18418 / T49) TaxID=1303518 RepID=S0EUC0_CHTCT|nr:hypothetical protein [Chthonomonas calidirosea]CCW35246.1 hypothetical protein CCALI_01430 [Chthonomonas calidirosea T49]CEK20738.1 hypothetical protein CTKA_02670 [Chthonomonas calidirosea]
MTGISSYQRVSNRKNLRAIARILGAQDDNIKYNQRNETLEQRGGVVQQAQGPAPTIWV